MREFKYVIMTTEGPKAWVRGFGFMSIPADESFDGRYGCYGVRNEKDRRYWDINEGGEFTYKAVIDDFGNLKQINIATNIRGY